MAISPRNFVNRYKHVFILLDVFNVKTMMAEMNQIVSHQIIPRGGEARGVVVESV